MITKIQPSPYTFHFIVESCGIDYESYIEFSWIKFPILSSNTIGKIVFHKGVLLDYGQ
jgi:hypothetical protein